MEWSLPFARELLERCRAPRETFTKYFREMYIGTLEQVLQITVQVLLRKVLLVLTYESNFSICFRGQIYFSLLTASRGRDLSIYV
jgi:hypothetical protein